MTPIISMTGNSRPDEVLTYFSHGMNDVLPKPFTKEGILSMLEVSGCPCWPRRLYESAAPMQHRNASFFSLEVVR